MNAPNELPYRTGHDGHNGIGAAIHSQTNVTLLAIRSAIDYARQNYLQGNMRKYSEWMQHAEDLMKELK